MPKRDARKLDHKTLEEIRTRAVEQVQAGESPEVVIRRSASVGRAFTTGWLATEPAAGVGLKAKPLAGRPKKMNGAQLRWLYGTVVGKNPLQFRFQFALRMRWMIQILLRKQFGLKLSLSSVRVSAEAVGFDVPAAAVASLGAGPEAGRAVAPAENIRPFGFWRSGAGPPFCSATRRECARIITRARPGECGDRRRWSRRRDSVSG